LSIPVTCTPFAHLAHSWGIVSPIIHHLLELFIVIAFFLTFPYRISPKVVDDVRDSTGLYACSAARRV
jgi:hypothetical protein